ncbi:NADH dehydrogenase [Haloactinopolyspora alba]|uniref:NADH dehydrogenase n=1 Tax=Haloactinopolyspora alba TaxID=648780 RepID=A0A2P8E8V8_9ACTN|nr:NAD(P)/FAD-dependent oxidoreductase [Haloactinopolyspora alba]PSL05868.1 NADH dehydrogenase [Haloactinopolyspora alba]
MTATAEGRQRVVIIGAGYAGMYAARRLQAKLRRGEASVTVVDPRPYMTYQPLLPDAAAGSVEPRHVVAPLRQLLSRCRVLTATATAIDATRRTVRVTVGDGHVEELSYDVLVVAPGSVTRTLPVPGLREQGVGFTTVEEAIYLRNHVLAQLDLAASTLDPALRRRALTFVFVGAGYAGVEALGGLEEMARFAARRFYGSVDMSDMRWVLVEAMDRIMPEVGDSLAAYATRELRERGIEVRLGTTVSSMEDGSVVLDDGTHFDAATIVWTAGVSPHPLLASSDLPLDERGRAQCEATLQVEGFPRVFGAGDCAAVPDLTADEPGAVCPPTAQHAVRQAKVLADNVVAQLRGRPVRNFRHVYAGAVAALGLHDGVAEIYGVRVRGFPAWLLHRLYHLSTMPTVNRKARILADWSLAVPFPREIVALGELHEPREEFVDVAHR